jgi:hypothetical protein
MRDRCTSEDSLLLDGVILDPACVVDKGMAVVLAAHDHDLDSRIWSTSSLRAGADLGDLGVPKLPAGLAESFV